MLAYRVTAWDCDAQDAVVEIDISLPEASKASVSAAERDVATVRAYCHPTNKALSALNTVLFALGARDIVSEKVFRLPNKTADGYFSYHLFAKVMDVAEAVVYIGDMKIILDTALPKDICKDDYISFDVLRLDCTFC